MQNYWARFEKIDQHLFRFDTRIYLEPIENPGLNDECLGAIVGKNPGSAIPANETVRELQPINLNGDRLLPTVRNIVKKAYEEVEINLPERGYIQVLNLFYLCNQNLGQAIAAMDNFGEPPCCETEQNHFPWVWYAWGEPDQDLNDYKGRFAEMDTEAQFYYDPHQKKIIETWPGFAGFARHTQGLKHACVIPYISGLIQNG